jgi:pimeloyl-ACP methyl ester carboxylesterase
MVSRRTLPAAVVAAGLLGLAVQAAAAELAACRLKGVAYEALCGSVKRALEPGRPGGTTIEVHFAVLPALARNKLPDPVFYFAGGPGQSAVELAGPLSAQLSRFSNRRDLVFIDQRGTGRSAPLKCDEKGDAFRPMTELLDDAVQQRRLADCRARLGLLPHGDLRQYTTTIAMADAEAVRLALGAERINLIGASYGTRAALEYMRRFPQRVRRAVLDGAAPADMALPTSSSTDNQAALDGLLDWCAADRECNARHPQLAQRWQTLLGTMPREVPVVHPYTGHEERLRLTRDALVGLVRKPLYAPSLAAGLPQAIDEATQGRFTPLIGLSAALGGAAGNMYTGMHFSVVCTEDVGRPVSGKGPPGADFGTSFARLYEQACADWPRGIVSDAFYSIPAAPSATLVLSGSADPATPPHHGERVTRALGAKAKHAVVPNAGHGVMGLPCMREALYRFIDAASDGEALAVDADCAKAIPRPPAFAPVATRAAAAGASK